MLYVYLKGGVGVTSKGRYTLLINEHWERRGTIEDLYQQKDTFLNDVYDDFILGTLLIVYAPKDATK